MAKKTSIKDRIVEIRVMKGRDILPNPRNWRRHPKSQRDALAGVVNELGKAGVLIARTNADGAVEALDGHARVAEFPDEEWHVAITDLSEKEAAYFLATFDPLGALAEADNLLLGEVLRMVDSGDRAVQEMLANLADKADFLPDGDGDDDDFEDGIDGEDNDNDGELSGTFFVLGEVRFPVDREVYLEWLEDVRQRVGFEQDKIEREVRRRLKL